MRDALRDFNHETRKSAELAAREADVEARAYAAWVDARKNGDWEAFAPAMEEASKPGAGEDGGEGGRWIRVKYCCWRAGFASTLYLSLRKKKRRFHVAPKAAFIFTYFRVPSFCWVPLADVYVRTIHTMFYDFCGTEITSSFHHAPPSSPPPVFAIFAFFTFPISVRQ